MKPKNLLMSQYHLAAEPLHVCINKYISSALMNKLIDMSDIVCSMSTAQYYSFIGKMSYNYCKNEIIIQLAGC